MAKTRSLDESFWDDPDVALLSRDERLLLVGMITLVADDEGRLIAEPGYLRKRIFGYDEGLTRAEVEAWRNTIVANCRNVKMYQAEDQVYIWLANFDTYQKIRYVIPSKLPAHTEESEIVLSNKEDCDNLPQSPATSRLSRVKVELSRVGVSSAEKSATAPTSPPKKKRDPTRMTSYPDDFAITPDMQEWAQKNVPGLNIGTATKEWANSMQSNRSKYRYTDWVAAWRTGMTRAHRWSSGGNNGANQVLTDTAKPTEIRGPDRAGFKRVLETDRPETRAG